MKIKGYLVGIVFWLSVLILVIISILRLTGIKNVKDSIFYSCSLFLFLMWAILFTKSEVTSCSSKFEFSKRIKTLLSLELFMVCLGFMTILYCIFLSIMPVLGIIVLRPSVSEMLSLSLEEGVSFLSTILTIAGVLMIVGWTAKWITIRMYGKPILKEEVK